MRVHNSIYFPKGLDLTFHEGDLSRVSKYDVFWTMRMTELRWMSMTDEGDANVLIVNT